jgi:hypothetical protein
MKISFPIAVTIVVKPLVGYRSVEDVVEYGIAV